MFTHMISYIYFIFKYFEKQIHYIECCKLRLKILKEKHQKINTTNFKTDTGKAPSSVILFFSKRQITMKEALCLKMTL